MDLKARVLMLTMTRAVILIAIDLNDYKQLTYVVFVEGRCFDLPLPEIPRLELRRLCHRLTVSRMPLRQSFNGPVFNRRALRRRSTQQCCIRLDARVDNSVYGAVASGGDVLAEGRVPMPLYQHDVPIRLQMDSV